MPHHLPPSGLYALGVLLVTAPGARDAPALQWRAVLAAGALPALAAIACLGALGE